MFDFKKAPPRPRPKPKTPKVKPPVKEELNPNSSILKPTAAVLKGNKIVGKSNVDKSFLEVEFEVSSSSAYLRNRSLEWAEIKYKKGDPDLPTKLSKDKKEIPDESYIGKVKKIPLGTKVYIDDIYIQPAKNKTSNEKLKYVHVVGYGWTSAGNVKGGLKNHSVGMLESVKPYSMETDHYTVGVEKAVVLKEGYRYLLYADKRKIPLAKEIIVKNTFKGFYGNNKSRNLAKVTCEGKTVYTSKGNYAKKAHDTKEVNKRKITDSSAYERRKVPSFIPKEKETMFLGKPVIIGARVEKETGTYVEIFDVVCIEGKTDEICYAPDKKIGWTNLLNLTHGFHTDLKGVNAKWDQVIPDERYDRAKGKDTEGTAKFTGNDDMIKIVDSKGDIEYVSKQIWPSLKNMLDTAQSAGHNLMVNTGFRHWDYQQAMVDHPRRRANPVGYSSHQIGIAADLTNKQDITDGGMNWWMERNAYKFGFVRTYQKFEEGHHWEYRPSEVVVPKEVEIDGKKYMKYTFATFDSTSTLIWDRNHVLDEISN